MAQIGIFVGTVYGNALLVAEEAEPVLQAQGHEVKILEDPRLSDWQQYSDKVALVVTSTTGHGDFPDSIAGLYHDVKDKLGHQPQLRYGVIALGDSSYENFCGAGKTFDAQLQEQGATRVGEVLLVDAMESPEPESVSTPWVENWGKLL
ncbi:flavodoxin [Mixta calida]|uniref:flavodoxin n=1 Tax=Mixta calida TaxID=665913 RepID=UPI00403AEDBB